MIMKIKLDLLNYLVKKKFKPMNFYLIFKALHLIAVISWMAGLLYLPRIFVYHVENYEKKETTDIFEIMERKTLQLYYEASNDCHLDIWNHINLFKRL